ncbi:MAG: putative serine protease, subtilase family [Actinotalea sp.]|nr:putative serine protease, subtilase family [Actinotalea sp.]
MKKMLALTLAGLLAVVSGAPAFATDDTAADDPALAAPASAGYAGEAGGFAADQAQGLPYELPQGQTPVPEQSEETQEGQVLSGGGYPPTTPTEPTKVFVCLYAGTPGVDEQLEDGANPVSMNIADIHPYEGLGSYFAGPDGRAYVLDEDRTAGGYGAPDVSECPQADGEPENTVHYVTVLWEVVDTDGNGDDWDQVYVAHEQTAVPELGALDGLLVDVDCRRYQVDIYHYTTDAERALVDALVAGGVLYGPDNPIDEPLIDGGAGVAWKMVGLLGECEASVTLTPPTVTDLCGTADDAVVVPADTAEIAYTVTVTGPGAWTVTATPKAGYAIPAPGTEDTYTLTPYGKAVWTLTATEVPCLTTITLPPAPSPVDECGTDGDVWLVQEPGAGAGYTVVASEDGEVLQIVAVAGHTFDADLATGLYGDLPSFTSATSTTLTFTYEFSDEPCLTTVSLPAPPAVVDVCGTAEDGWVSVEPAPGAGYTVVENGDVLMLVAAPGSAFDAAAATTLYTGVAGFTSATATAITFTHEFTDVPCLVTVTLPAPPTFADLCGTVNDGWDIAEPSASAGYTVVEGGDVLQLVASPGYTFDAAAATSLFSAVAGFTGATSTTITFTHDFTNQSCAESFAPVAPTVTHQVVLCSPSYSLETSSGAITVARTPGVEYLLGGVVVSGSTSVAPGSYVVTARPVGDTAPTQDFAVTINAGTAPSCILPVVNVIPTVPTAPTAPIIRSAPAPLAPVSSATPRALASTGLAGELPLAGIVGLLGLGVLLTAAARLRGPRETS